MTAAWTAYRKAAHLRRWSSAGDHLARHVAPHPWLIATAKQLLDPLSARPPVPHRAAGVTTSPSLPAQSTILTLPAAAKSP
jgi:hypothetical protein